MIGCISCNLAGEAGELGPPRFKTEEGFRKLKILFNSGDFVIDAVALFLQLLQPGLVGGDPLIQADGDVF